MEELARIHDPGNRLRIRNMYEHDKILIEKYIQLRTIECKYYLDCHTFTESNAHENDDDTPSIPIQSQDEKYMEAFKKLQEVQIIEDINSFKYLCYSKHQLLMSALNKVNEVLKENKIDMRLYVVNSDLNEALEFLKSLLYLSQSYDNGG